ncbi:MAG: hypothetical protein ACI4PF_03835 [Christensenellales bacterium]
MKDIKTKNYNICYWNNYPTYDNDKIYYLLEIQRFKGDEFDRQYNKYVLETKDKALEKVFIGLLESEEFIKMITHIKDKIINIKEVVAIYFYHQNDFNRR